ncbi:MAG: DUF5615 family PIN-like protein [Planctomycetota bacterium]
MKFKLDENIGSRYSEPLRNAGHDVSTVAAQGMAGAKDERLIEVCQSESRCLVTLDAEFGNPLIHDPSQYAGIALLRLPRRWAPDALTACMASLATALESASIEGRLWIVQPDRVREYQQE